MNSFTSQKAQELCFALLRVAAHIRRFELRRTIERLSYHLLENISYQNPEMTLSTIAAIRNFVVLAKNVYELEPLNAKIIERELEHLANEVRRIEGMLELPDLENMFTKRLEMKQLPKAKRQRQELPGEIVIPEAEMRNEEVGYGNPEIEIQEDGNSVIRKEKIFVMLSTAPEKRLALKEVVSAFPEVSERTIRYDLKKLAAEGRVIRQGSGGPSNYYMVKHREPVSSVINASSASL